LAAATGAFAQSSVTISGTFDPSVANQKITYVNGNSVSQNAVYNNAQGTSQVTFKGVEDLGGGLKASFLLENDFSTRTDATVAGLGTAAMANQSQTPKYGVGNFGALGGEQYLGLEGGFGSVKIGAPNTPTLTAQSASNPFGTKIGGGFGVVNSGKVRNSNTVVYATPVFNGFSAAAAYSFKSNVDANPTNGVAPVAAITDIGLNYVNGPLAAGFSNYKVSDLAAAAAMGTTAATTAAVSKTDNNLYATYDFGVAKLGAGYFTQKQGTTIDTQGYSVSATVPLNASLSLLANYGKKNDKLAANADATIGAIGLKYALSARTSMYARYVDQKNDNLTTLTSAKKVQTALVGMQHNF
jgi:predicted porin